MWRPCSILFLLLMTLWFGQAAAADTTPADAGRICLEMVDRDGAAVKGLAPDEVQVVLGGKPLAIATLETAPPLSLVILLDVSHPAIPHQDALRRAMDSLAAALRPEDELSVMVFAASSSLLFPFSHDHLDTRRKALSYQIQAAAPNRALIWDGVAAAVEAVARRDGRRAVLTFTQGFDSGSQARPADVASAAQEAGVRLDFVHTPRPSSWSGGYWRQLVGALDEAAAASGGTVTRVAEPEAFQAAFTTVATALQAGICLVRKAPPTAGGQLARLKLRSSRKGVRLLAPTRAPATPAR